MKKNNLILTAFSLSFFLVLGMLFLLQIIDPPWFYLLLIIMHGGIAALAILKRKTKAYDIKKFFSNAYLIWLVFIPILAYKLLARVFTYPINQSLLLSLTIAATVIVFIAGAINIYFLRKKLLSFTE